MNRTNIEWTRGPNGAPGYTWNCVVGCEGPNGTPCPYCYGRRMAARRMGEYGKQPIGQEFKPRFLPERLDEPLKLRKPSRIFVGSMTDLFGPAVKTEWLDDILEVIAACPQHTFIALTKRPDRLDEMLYGVTSENGCRELGGGDYLPNLWLGTSVTNQQDVEDRLPWLREILASVKWVSVEPLHEYVYLGQYLDMVQWVVIGGETGNRAGKIMPERHWVDALVAQCQMAGVAVFEKRSLSAIVDRPLIQEYPGAKS